MYPVNRIYDASVLNAPSRTLDFPGIMRQVYLWLAGGLAVGVGIAFVFGQVIISQLNAGMSADTIFLLNPAVMIGGIVIYLVLGFGFYPIVKRASPAIGGALFLLFAAIFGFMTATIFLEFTLSSIAAAFLTTAAMFAVMSVLGYTTRMDLSKLGSVLLMALIGIIAASVVNLFIQDSIVGWVVSIIGVLVFSGLTAYDTQWIKRNAESLAESGTDQAAARIALIGAFRLFLDFINLFLDLLQILSGGRRP